MQRAAAHQTLHKKISAVLAQYQLSGAAARDTAFAFVAFARLLGRELNAQNLADALDISLAGCEAFTRMLPLDLAKLKEELLSLVALTRPGPVQDKPVAPLLLTLHPNLAEASPAVLQPELMWHDYGPQVMDPRDVCGLLDHLQPDIVVFVSYSWLHSSALLLPAETYNKYEIWQSALAAQPDLDLRAKDLGSALRLQEALVRLTKGNSKRCLVFFELRQHVLALAHGLEAPQHSSIQTVYFSADCTRSYLAPYNRHCRLRLVCPLAAKETDAASAGGTDDAVGGEEETDCVLASHDQRILTVELGAKD